MRRAVAAAMAAVCCFATACSGDDDSSESSDKTSSESAASAKGSPTQSWKDASTAQPGSEDLDWKVHNVSDSGIAAATRGWTGVADSLGKKVTLSGPGKTVRYAPKRGQVTAIEMQWPWAVVYAGGNLTNQAAGPGELAVFDLRRGERRMVGKDGSAPPPSASGSVAMHDGELAYPTGPNNHFCLARLDLRTLDGKRVECAKPLKEGFSEFRLSDSGLGYTSFDNKRPAPCMTLKEVRDGETGTVDAAKPCVGWEVVPGTDSALWLQIRNRHRVEIATAYARDTEGKVAKLGPALSGSTTWCAGATYFVRPTSKDGTADDLMRWSPDDGLDVVWSPGKRKVSFVFPPQCGGSSITLPGLDGKQQPIVMSAPV